MKQKTEEQIRIERSNKENYQSKQLFKNNKIVKLLARLIK